MQTVVNVQALHAVLSKYRQQGLRVGFVPTMGNLHDGHLALVDAAIKQCDKVVVSIFVNPMQFSANEDFDTYPVTPEEDEQALIDHKVSLLYRPQLKEIYPSGLSAQTKVEVSDLSDMLCGLSRPHFFSGVATVVNILFNQVRADVAFFGKKDYQQYLIVKKMASDLSLDTRVEGIDTVRLESGLAMSSRNHYLSSDEKIQAANLYRILGELASSYKTGSRNKAIELGLGQLSECGFDVDYLELRRQSDLSEPSENDLKLIVLAAVWLGKTRLIDNLEFSL